ncbi:MAG TPA: MFS transporter [Streptosporangiaceae bacterium]
MRLAQKETGPGQRARRVRYGRRLTRTGLGALLAALAVEFADELFDGTKSAALPLIRHDLALTYVQVGLLAAVPLLLGSMLELPFGVLSGTGARRRRFILAGGVVFVASVLAAGLARSFWMLLVALVVFFPASGIFVSLTQAELLDAEPGRRAQRMARWTLAGSLGGVAGPLLVTAVLAVGGTWRLSIVLVGAASAAAWLAVAGAGRRVRLRLPGRRPVQAAEPGPAESGPAQSGPAQSRPAQSGPAQSGPAESTAVEAAEGGLAPAAESDSADYGDWPGWREAAAVIRRSGAVRWLVLLQISDVLLDVLTSFLALYLVVVVHASPGVAALGVAVRLGAGLAGDVLLIRVLDGLDARRVLRVSVWLTCVLFPAFLLVPGLGAKLVVLALLTIATAPWYPVLQAELFGSLPGRSGLAVSLSSGAGLVGGLGPLAVGLIAQWLGLTWAMAVMGVVPIAMLAIPAGNRVAGGPGGSTKLHVRD